MTIQSLFPPRAATAPAPAKLSPLVLRCLIANDLSTLQHLTAALSSDEAFVTEDSPERDVLLGKFTTVLERIRARRAALAALTPA